MHIHVHKTRTLDILYNLFMIDAHLIIGKKYCHQTKTVILGVIVE